MYISIYLLFPTSPFRHAFILSFHFQANILDNPGILVSVPHNSFGTFYNWLCLPSPLLPPSQPHRETLAVTRTRSSICLLPYGCSSAFIPEHQPPSPQFIKATTTTTKSFRLSSSGTWLKCNGLFKHIVKNSWRRFIHPVFHYAIYKDPFASSMWIFSGAFACTRQNKKANRRVFYILQYSPI